MYLIVIVWTYVTLMMAVAEATSPVGTVMGAVITFVLYGLLPMSILVYILGTPGRKRKLRARAEAEQAAYDAQQAALAAAQAGDAPGGASAPRAGASSVTPTSVTPVPVTPVSITPDADGEAPAAAPGDAVAPVRKEP